MTAHLLGAADSDALVDCAVGDELVVRLEENPTTGYRWEPVDLPASLELTDDAFELAQPTAIGSGGTRQYTFTCTAAGDSELRLRHWQAWEGVVSTTQEVIFQLRVRTG